MFTNEVNKVSSQRGPKAEADLEVHQTTA